MLLFVGQVIAMPLMVCCEDADIVMSQGHELDTADHHHSDFAGHDDEPCNHHCDVCLGTVLATKVEPFAPLMTGALLAALYDFSLPSSSSESPFKPPITA